MPKVGEIMCYVWMTTRLLGDHQKWRCWI